tara:strand:+ start:79 stop:369 length:291 start_codon:yes stop_codon:yes gene_type:complete
MSDRDAPRVPKNARTTTTKNKTRVSILFKKVRVRFRPFLLFFGWMRGIKTRIAPKEWRTYRHIIAIRRRSRVVNLAAHAWFPHLPGFRDDDWIVFA